MDGMHGYEAALEQLRKGTGVIIPVHVPAAVAGEQAAAMLRETARSFCQVVADPRRVCLSVDGEDCGAELAGQVAGECGASVVVQPRNRGKLAGIVAGARHLLAAGGLGYLAAVDQDGDHFANELLNFVRAAMHTESHARTQRVLVLGRRLSRHRPMGLVRGEQEELADRVLLDALAYRAAVAGRPLRLELASVFDEFPDFHSGYKLFTAACAADVFGGEPDLAGCDEACYWRHAVEVVLTVEAMERGAVLAVVNRSTINEQPLSIFGRLDRVRLVADMIIWPCRRLGVPPAFVRQWLDNHLARLGLWTLAPAGKDELRAVRAAVLEAFGLKAEADPPQPMFL